jgi:hypothetical protein
MIRLAAVALVAAVLGFIYIIASRKGNGTMKNERQITAAELSSMEEAIELSIAYDHADTREFTALKKEYRKAKRLYKKQQRRG